MLNHNLRTRPCPAYLSARQTLAKSGPDSYRDTPNASRLQSPLISDDTNPALRKPSIACSVTSSNSLNKALSSFLKLKHDLPCIRAFNSLDMPSSNLGFA